MDVVDARAELRPPCRTYAPTLSLSLARSLASTLCASLTPSLPPSLAPYLASSSLAPLDIWAHRPVAPRYNQAGLTPPKSLVQLFLPILGTMMVFKRSSTPARRALGGLVVAAMVACVSMMIEAKNSHVRKITNYDEYTEAINDGKVYITAYKVRAG